ncbi:MAG: hypothetical protein L6R38_004885 [Xanthoria sp. 2 TBL-2021]|nr:MAG: hypothetical protein L6R38_004885 [Xanthoria sp. 2 TBL-2021]
MALATLDLSLFTNGNHNTREAFAADLRKELSRHGFVKIVCHGLSDEDIGEVFEWNKRFFQLSLDDKAAIVHPGGSDPQRGWSAVGKENAASLYRTGFLKAKMANPLKDSREHFDQGSAMDLRYPNRWPQEGILPGFREFMESWYEKMEEVAVRLMEALEYAFQLPPGSFLDKMTHDKNASEARLLHYPAIDMTEINKGAVSRIWPHFDLGVITLLFQDGVGGLECENRDDGGKFFSVVSNSRSEMVVNVSETMQRWTNDAVPAGLHRVTVPKAFEQRECGMVPERYSVTYFCKADGDASVGALPQFVPGGSKARYDDMTAIEYHQSRLRSAY